MNSCGIYKITNTVTGDFYIGSACNLSRRLRDHRSALVGNRHGNIHLQNAWNKYGQDCFGFSVCECCKKERLLEREQFYIDNEKPSYNILQIAGSPTGFKHTEEARAAISAGHMGALNHNFGRTFTDEEIANMSAAHMGKPCTPEARAKMSAANMGENNHNFGKPGTMTGKHHNEEARANISASLKGKCTGENNGMFGKHHSDETKRKMGESNERWRAEKESMK